MSALYADHAASLAELAAAIGRDADATRLKAAADELSAKIVAHLWDEESGAYVNREPGGGWRRRVSPTSFYLLITGAPPDAHALEMVRRWPTNGTRGCVQRRAAAAAEVEAAAATTAPPAKPPSRGGEKCFWGLPSIAADDRAFGPGRGAHWRGLVWGPMTLLTYWGLRRYDHLPEVRAARLALVAQHRALFLSVWRHAHVCELLAGARARRATATTARG